MGPWISRRGNNCKALFCTFTELATPPCHLPLTRTAPQTGSGPFVRSHAILQAQLLVPGVSAPSQPQPPLGKSCNRQIALVWSCFSPPRMVWGWSGHDSQDDGGKENSCRNLLIFKMNPVCLYCPLCFFYKLEIPQDEKLKLEKCTSTLCDEQGWLLVIYLLLGEKWNLQNYM